MAPISAAMMTVSPTLKSSSLPIVLETLPPNTNTVTRAPSRLKTAETTTAAPAESARVDTEVAMALAVSWKPLVKSKQTATRMVTKSRYSVSCS